MEPAEFWVTGGVTVALLLLHCEVDGDRTDVAGAADVARLHARAKGVRNAIAGGWRTRSLSQTGVDEALIVDVARLAM